MSEKLPKSTILLANGETLEADSGVMRTVGEVHILINSNRYFLPPNIFRSPVPWKKIDDQTTPEYVASLFPPDNKESVGFVFTHKTTAVVQMGEEKVRFDSEYHHSRRFFVDAQLITAEEVRARKPFLSEDDKNRIVEDAKYILARNGAIYLHDETDMLIATPQLQSESQDQAS